MNERTKALIGLHISIFLVGITGLLGKVMSTSAIFIVFGRVLFASIALGLFLKYRKEAILPRSLRDGLVFILIGVLITFHWYAFFYSIQLSSVAIGLLTFSTFPIFTILLEPVFFKGRLKAWDIGVACLCCIGVWLVVPYDMDVPSSYVLGALWGIAAGLSYSFILLLHKAYVQSYSAVNLTFYQCFVAALLTLPIVLWMSEPVSSIDWLYVFLNGVICTAFAHALYIYSARYVEAKIISISTMLELLYGVIFAYFLLGETLTMKMVAGGILIVLASYLAVKKNT
ncbi:MAG: DMT family transporter [Alphaproteobacteria bacterium]